jgi:hypothetical protein
MLSDGLTAALSRTIALRSATHPRSSTSNATCVRTRSSKLRRGTRTSARSAAANASIATTATAPSAATCFTTRLAPRSAANAALEKTGERFVKAWKTGKSAGDIRAQFDLRAVA